MMPSALPHLMWIQLMQVTLVALLGWVVWRLAAKDRPHLAHAIWALVLIKCITPPVFTSPISPFSWTLQAQNSTAIGDRKPSTALPGSPGNTNLDPIEIHMAASNRPSVAASNATETSSYQSVDWGKHFRQLHWYLWAAGGLIGLLFVAIRYFRFARLIQSHKLIENTLAHEVAESLQKQLRIKRNVCLLVIDGLIGPAVMGVIRPTILIPAMIVQGKSKAELEPLIAHELIHVRRGDLWWSLMQSVAKSLWWFHPLVWLSGRMLNREAERSCDEETVASLGCKPSLYARSLLSVLEEKHRLRVAPALPGVRPIDITSNRLERIMRLGQGSHRRNPKWTWAFMLAAGICILPGATSVTGQAPQSSPTSSPTVGKPADSLTQNATDESSTGYSLQTYNAADLINDLTKQGLSPEQAQKKILDRLPTTSVVVSPKREKKSDDQIRSAPLPASDVRSLAPPVSDKTTRVFDGNMLIVNATNPTHDVINKSLVHHRKFGFQYLKITMLIAEVTGDKVDQLAVQTAGGKAVSGDAGVTGTIVQDSKTSSIVANIDRERFDETFRKLQQQRELDILSRPTFMTANGRPATIQIGRQLDPAIGDVHLGITSTVLPRLSQDKQVELEIDFEHSEIDPRNSIRDESTSADGKSVSRDIPGIRTVKFQTAVKTKLNTSLLISGPLQVKELVTKTDGKESSRLVKKCIVALITCQIVDPIGKPNKQDNASLPGSGRSESPDAKLTFRSGTSTIKINGNVRADRSKSAEGHVRVIGKNLRIVMEEPDVSPEHYSKIQADAGSIMIPALEGDAFDHLEWQLQDNVIVQMNQDESIKAKTLSRSKDGRISGTFAMVDFEEFKVQADQLSFDSPWASMNAKGNVRIEPDSTSQIQADSITWNMQSGDMQARDNVIAKYDRVSLRADKLDLNTRSRKITNVTVREIQIQVPDHASKQRINR